MMSSNDKTDTWEIRFQYASRMFRSASDVINALKTEYRGCHVTVFSPRKPYRFVSVSETGKPVFTYAHETPIRQGDPVKISHFQ